MRQRLPESAGYPLLVGDISRTVSPGEEFDAPLLVPGCVPVEDGEGGATSAADSAAEPGAGEDTGGGDEGAQAATEPGKPRTKGGRL